MVPIVSLVKFPIRKSILAFPLNFGNMFMFFRFFFNYCGYLTYFNEKLTSFDLLKVQ